MLFARKQKKSAPDQTKSTKAVVTTDGYTALLRSEVDFCDAVCMTKTTHHQFASAIGAVEPAALAAVQHLAPSALGLSGIVAGLAATGLRTVAFTDSNGLLAMHEGLLALAARQTPAVFIAGCQVPDRPGGSDLDGHDALHAIADSGAFVLIAGDVQQAVDFALIAHQVAEQTLAPAIVSIDHRATGRSAQPVEVPEQRIREKFFRPSDTQRITHPFTTARPASRAGLPVALSLDHPTGFGGSLDSHSYRRAAAARQLFFARHMPLALAAAFARFAELTGRHYQPLSSYGLDDADYVLLLQGAGTTAAREAIDRLRTTTKHKIGLLTINLLRPFPAAELTQALKGRRAVTVLERLDRPVFAEPPLLADLRAAFDRAAENAAAGAKPLPWPGLAAFRQPGDRPRLYSGVALLEPDTAVPAFEAALRNMLPEGDNRSFYYLGVHLGREHQPYPNLEIRQQHLRQRHPELLQHVLPLAAPDKTPLAGPEPEAPWTVRAVRQFGQDATDLARFWESTGFFYATGQPEEPLVEPLAATAAMPARSAAFRRRDSERKTMLRLIPENLPDAGLGWLFSFGSGLQASLQSVSSLIETAKAICEGKGQSFVQLPRFLAHLAQQAYRLIVNDDTQRYCHAGLLLRDAGEAVQNKLPKRDDKLAAELAPLVAELETLVIAKTERFFDALHREEKGSGLLLVFAIDPDAEHDHSLLLARCPELTAEEVPATPERLAAARHDWELLQQLPELPVPQIERFISEDEPETHLLYLLNRKVYHAMLGGLPSQSGSGAALALRLIASAVEAAMQPRLQALLEQLRQLKTKIERKLQDSVSSAVEINDFAAFAERLTHVASATPGIAELAEAAKPGAAAAIEKKRLQRLAGLQQRLESLIGTYEQAANGDGRARFAMTLAGEAAIAAAGQFPHNPFAAPWLAVRRSAGGECAGIFEGVLRQMNDAFATIREGEAELAGRQFSAPATPWRWHDLTAEERQWCPPVLAVTSENSLDTVANVLSSGLPVKLVYLDREGTGAVGPATMAMLQRRFLVVQSTIGLPEHLLQSALAAARHPGPAFLHIYAPERSQPEHDNAWIVALARLAVATRTFPAFHFEPGEPDSLGGKLRLDGNPQPERDWVVEPLQAEQASGVAKEVEQHLTPADWLAQCEGSAPAFTLVAEKEWHDGMLPVHDYVALSPADREGRQPYILQLDARNRLRRLVAPAEAVDLCEARLARWRLLRELQQLSAPAVQPKAAASEPQPEERKPAAVENGAQVHARLTQKLLALSGFGQQDMEQQNRPRLRDYLKRRAAATAPADSKEKGGAA